LKSTSTCVSEEDIQYLTHTLKSKERHTLEKYDTLMASATQFKSEGQILGELKVELPFWHFLAFGIL
jgi:hypothetical protein